MNDMNLQMFADETSAEPTPDMAVHVDDGGLRRVVPVTPTEEAPAEETPAEPEEAAPQLYDAGTLLTAMAMGNVDENLIPPELVGQYQAALLRQQIKNQPQMPPPPAPTSEQAPPPPAPQEVYTRLHDLAAAKAMEDMGLTPQKISEMEEAASYSDEPNDANKKKLSEYNAAVNIYTMALVSEAQRQRETIERQAQERRAVIEEVTPEIEEYKKDPNFPIIDRMMYDFYETMPYKQAVAIKDILDRLNNNGPITRSDIAPLREYYKATREAYYAKVSGVPAKPVPAKPPVVESPGTAAKQAAKPIDWASMRNMDARERSEFLRKHI